MFRLLESKSLAEILFPKIELAELQIFDASTQHHLKQIERRREPQVESEVGQAVPMTLIAREGKFVADGQSIRRVE
jgi:hypothetical protein